MNSHGSSPLGKIIALTSVCVLTIAGAERLFRPSDSWAEVLVFANVDEEQGKDAPNLSDDWPGYKRDAERSGVTTANVPLPLKVLWSHASNQPPRPAWSEPGRALNMLDFDYCFQPIAAAGLVFFGSSADDTVRALKADNGELVWSFTTGGPIRFAPHIAGDKCYFASDDGHAYCAEARTGIPDATPEATFPFAPSRYT